MPYDVALVRSVPVNSRFRVLVDTNRYSVPAHLAGATLTAKIYPERLAFYQENQCVTEHVRSYDRHQDFERPEPDLSLYDPPPQTPPASHPS